MYSYYKIKNLKTRLIWSKKYGWCKHGNPIYSLTKARQIVTDLMLVDNTLELKIKMLNTLAW